MSYIQTVTELETAANLVNPTGRFDHGRTVDVSQAFNGAYPLIWLYNMNIDIPSPTAPEFLDDNIILMGFWLQDKPASSTTERKLLIAQADVLVRAFLQQLSTSKVIRIVGKIRAEPQYGMYNGTLSGMAIRFTYENFAPCP